MNFYNEDYLKFNSLYISSDGRSAGIGTYSNSLGFMCGSVSVGLTTSTSAGASASFVYAPRTISMSGNTTYNPGTNSICYINKTNTSNLILTIATPSNDGIYLILRVILFIMECIYYFRNLNYYKYRISVILLNKI